MGTTGKKRTNHLEEISLQILREAGVKLEVKNKGFSIKLEKFTFLPKSARMALDVLIGKYDYTLHLEDKLYGNFNLGEKAA